MALMPHDSPRRGSRRLLADILRVLAALSLIVPVWGAAASRETTPAVDFDRVIRPILSENCYKCHGPDEGERKAKLQFDLRAEALKPAKSGNVPIVPGAPAKSEMIARITAVDGDDRMPPEKTGKTLSPVQIEALRNWIAQGRPIPRIGLMSNPCAPQCRPSAIENGRGIRLTRSSSSGWRRKAWFPPRPPIAGL